MQDKAQELEKMLIRAKQEVSTDGDAAWLLEQAVSMIKSGSSLDKVIFTLNQNLNNYSLTHGFRLPAGLTELKIKLVEKPDKWSGAGVTGTI